IPADVKTEVEADVNELKKALEGEDTEAVRTAFDKLNASQSKLGQAMYAAAQEQAAAGSPTEEAAAGAEASSDATADGDVVDAEVVDEDNGAVSESSGGDADKGDADKG